jgi:hypothetical protein
VKQKAEENFGYFEHQINAAHLVLEQNQIPNIAIGKHCFSPYQCDFFGNCWKDTIQENSIFNLPYMDKGKLFEWYNGGIKTIDQVTDDLIEKPEALKIKKAFENNTTIIDLEKIKAFLLRVKESFVAMDMEIWSAALPQLEGTKPFEQIPFLVSFHNGKETTHYFSEHALDERKEFAEHLIKLSSAYASVIVYDKTMEVSAINNLINKYQDLATDLTLLKDKLVDVFDIFLNLSYYHPAFKSNFSLKIVSAVLLEDVNYTKISSGLEAMNYFEQFRLSETELDREVLKNELVNYCNTDTEVTFKLIAFLRKLTA